jgi:hypothetical protein
MIPASLSKAYEEAGGRRSSDGPVEAEEVEEIRLWTPGALLLGDPGQLGSTVHCLDFLTSLEVGRTFPYSFKL